MIIQQVRIILLYKQEKPNDTDGNLNIELDIGEIINSFSTGKVICAKTGGGLVGKNTSGNYKDTLRLPVIKYCYTRSTVQVEDTLGGFVGVNTGIIEKCYAANELIEGNVIGGFAAISDDTLITDSYWDIQESDITSSQGGTGKTTLEMKNQTTFENWDFDIVWALDGITNDGYPFFGDDLTSVETNFSNNSLTLYPNPVVNKLYYKFEKTVNINAIKIYTSIGELILTAIPDGLNSIKVSNLPKGAYIISFKTIDSNITKKFLK